MLDRILKNEINGAHHMVLADTIHPADALFYSHRVPGDVVVDHHVAKLKIQALAACIGGNENARLPGKAILGLFALIHIH